MSQTMNINSTQKIIKNSLYLILQPLILNVISIFAVGYIARYLGKAYYGQFIFAFSFIQLFAPIYMGGLSIYIVRTLAESKKDISLFVGKVLSLRIILGLIAMLLTVSVINFLGYSLNQKILVYIAAVTLVSNAILMTCIDIIQSFENMKYVSLINMISGLVLTALSVIAVFMGFGVKVLAMTYTFGNIVGMLLGLFLLNSKFVVPQLRFDLKFSKECLLNSFHFFYPNIAGMLGTKFCLVVLSKFSGDMSIGIYAAADNLVSRLMIVYDGTCSSFYPTMVSTYKKSIEEAISLFRKFFVYLLILGVPIAVGCSLLSKEIIFLIYSSSYIKSVLVLQISIWSLTFMFQNALMGYTIASIHKEKHSAMIRTVCASIAIILSFSIIPILKEIGLSISILASQFVLFIINVFLIQRFLTVCLIKRSHLLKVILVNGLLAFFILMIRGLNLFIVVLMAVSFYFILIMYVKIFDLHEFVKNFYSRNLSKGK